MLAQAPDLVMAVHKGHPLSAEIMSHEGWRCLRKHEKEVPLQRRFFRPSDRYRDSSECISKLFLDRNSDEQLRPTLTHTKNLYENGPNPFFSGVFNLMGTRMVQIRMAKSV